VLGVLRCSAVCGVVHAVCVGMCMRAGGAPVQCGVRCGARGVWCARCVKEAIHKRARRVVPQALRERDATIRYVYVHACWGWVAGEGVPGNAIARASPSTAPTNLGLGFRI
jgi:hypothetical protein